MTNTATAPLDVVHAFMDAMAEKDYEVALPYIGENCEYYNSPMGTVRGPLGVRGVLEPFFAPTLENDLQVLREVANGPVVFLERLDRHLLETGWVELPVTGVFEVHDGQITVWREYFDGPTIQKVWPRPSAS